MLRVREGDSLALEAIFDRYYFRVVGFIRRYVDESDVEDVAQEVFMNVFQKIGQIHEAAAFERYLFQSAKNRSINWLKRKIRLRELMQIFWYAADTWKDTPGGSGIQRLTALQSLVESLPAEHRRYIEMFYIQKHSRSEIAALCQESSSTVYRRVAAARAALLELAAKQNLTIVFEGRHDIKIEEATADR
ncbi:MAG: RNA polymerase sigma factor [bacterium]